MPVFTAQGVTKRFGAVVALDGAELELNSGQVHALIGSNGSGKSTLCKIMAGSVRPDAGLISLKGEPVSWAGPQKAVRAGIGVFYQELSLVPQLSVMENLFLGSLPRKGPGLVDRAALRRAGEELVKKFEGVTGPGFSLEALVQDLNSDQRQIVEILKVLATGAEILIFDEPTSSLDQSQVGVFFDLLRGLRDQGRAIIFISHRMDEIFEIGDRVTVFRDGRSVACLDLVETDRDSLVEHMIGGRMAASGHGLRRIESGDSGERILRVEGLRGPRIKGVSFTLHRGEILGFGGLHGQGQSPVLRTLFGAEPAQGGRVAVYDRAGRPSRPAEAMARGLAYVSGDRGRDGVFLARPILENMVAADLTKNKRFFLNPQGLAKKTAPFVERLKLKFSGYTAPVSSLSGGNQQKVVIGRWLVVEPGILLLDDPTKGIDLEAKADLYGIMRQLAAEGVGIILYSSEDSELLGNADRILVFHGGRVVRSLEGGEMTAFNLYQAAYGAKSPGNGAEPAGPGEAAG